MSSSIDLQSAMFLADRLACLFDLLRDFFTLAHICHVLWISIDNVTVLVTLRELVKSFSVSSICVRTVFVYHYESIFLLPTVAAQRAKFVVRHRIIVNVFQVSTVLFEQDQKIHVVAYHMFRYPGVRLTEIEAVDVRVATHRKVFSQRILLIISRHQR